MLINNKNIGDEKVLALIKEIKAKKELKDISDNVVLNRIKEYLKKSKKAILYFQKDTTVAQMKRGSEYKKLLKSVRWTLRRLHGVYETYQLDERESLLEQLSKNPNSIELHKVLLGTHKSSNERISIYHHIYSKIFKITGKPKKILDLACGLNPFSYPFMKVNAEYIASDIDKRELALIRKYFKIKGIKGKTILIDLLNKYFNLPKVDVAFLFKVLEILELSKKHYKSEDIIKSIPAKYVVVSFPTITVKGDIMRHPRRKWIELMLERLVYSFDVIEEQNEIFYIIRKG